MALVLDSALGICEVSVSIINTLRRKISLQFGSTDNMIFLCVAKQENSGILAQVRVQVICRKMRAERVESYKLTGSNSLSSLDKTCIQ